MTTKRITTRVLATLTLLGGLGVGSAFAVPPMPKAEEMAAIAPKQAGAAAALTPADVARCRVTPYPNEKQPVGYVLTDANNRTVRRFLAVGAQNYNILSFYQNGQEVYRETEVPGGKQFRWLGTNGSRVGVDTDGNGTVDVWEAISPEEVSREIFEAVLKKDAAKLQALLVTPKDLQAIGLPAPQIQAITARTAKAVERLQATADALKLTDKAKWIHVELWAPETIPADEFQGRTDLVRHRNAGVLVDKGVDTQAVTFSLGELIQVGRAWKLVDGPSPISPASDPGTPGTGGVDIPPAAQELIKKIDGIPTVAYGTPGYGKFQMERAAVLNEVATKLQGNPSQEIFLKQLLDAYVAASEAGEAEGGKQLVAWRDQIEKVAKGSPIAGFAAFRVLGLEYSAKLTATNGRPKEIEDVQTWWRDSLASFIKTYPTNEETPEAHYRLALAEESRGKKGEEEAKAQYAAIAKNFPTHQLAAQAAGSIRRLECEGKPIALAGTTLGGQPVNVANLGGKVSIVYFWGSFQQDLKKDAAELAELAKKLGGNVNIVTVCLDTSAQVATKAATDAGLPGAHLFAADGSLAAQYGIIGTHLMLVGKDGKVANKNAQMAFLGEEAEKLSK
ncbi:redoxin domain-containing protein [Limnoglobus roseus]|uniref:Thioredoxin domain-containing protein n=1 Tax=Limnoglobus roseus TaxID=2598579 RepID=A0A5C1A869_9BACT|nr:redoxin domain-containing protein [Limnoglobus roseus]QEL14196.1 hypothetical protein PX52LOC_01066 [Limnoglobus roseus]